MPAIILFALFTLGSPAQAQPAFPESVQEFACNNKWWAPEVTLSEIRNAYLGQPTGEIAKLVIAEDFERCEQLDNAIIVLAALEDTSWLEHTKELIQKTKTPAADGRRLLIEGLPFALGMSAYYTKDARALQQLRDFIAINPQNFTPWMQQQIADLGQLGMLLQIGHAEGYAMSGTAEAKIYLEQKLQKLHPGDELYDFYVKANALWKSVNDHGLSHAFEQQLKN